MARIRGVLETVLYSEDLDRAEGFYAGVLGLAPVGGGSALMRTFRVAPGQVLLVFDPRESEPAGREVPSHGTRGAGHVALLVGEGGLAAWRERLAAHGVAIEQEVEWTWGETPQRSLYVRDPAGNSVELITGDIWAG